MGGLSHQSSLPLFQVSVVVTLPGTDGIGSPPRTPGGNRSALGDSRGPLGYY